MKTEPALPIDDLPPITASKDILAAIQRSVGGTEEERKEFLNKLLMYVAVISTDIDMSGLDGITVAVDYENALAEFNGSVGFLEGKKLKPTNDGIARGVAMTPAFLKDDEVKSHIFFNYYFVKGIDCDQDSEEFQTALYIIAHECAHVEATSELDLAFPDVLRRQYPDSWTALDQAKWKYATYACYQEYIACRRSSGFGKPPLDDQVDTLLQTLNGIEEKADRMIEECGRDKKDYQKLFHGLFPSYGKLMEYSCYVLGTMHGSGLTVEDVSSLRDGLADTWFASYFDSLGELCEALYESYGTWEDYGAFDPIGDLLEKIVARKGFSVRPCGDDFCVTLK